MALDTHPPVNAERPAPQLSDRAKKAKANAQPAVEAIFAKIFGPQYAPDTPDGLVNVGVAENSLMADWFLEHSKKLQLTYTDLTYGDALAGSRRLFAALSKLFTNYFHALKPVETKHMVCGVGVGSVLDQLAEKICDPGDHVLIAAPYYNGFDYDFGIRALAAVTAVNIPEGMDAASKETLKVFEAKITEMKQNGETAKAIILCNPNNPLGLIYPKETILEYCRFCEKHNLHLIADEIYALSLYKNKNLTEQTPFLSMLSIDVEKEAQCNPARVHVLYGMSKDFGANGLRVGVLVSQHNPELVKSMESSAIFMKISSASDQLWSSILSDDQILATYVAEAQSRASETLNYTLAWLDKMNIKYVNPTAGHYVWIDLRPYLPKKDKEGQAITDPALQERELFQRFLYDFDIYVAPGVIYHSPIPGFFRLTFTLRRRFLDEAMKRIDQALKQVKELNAQ